MGVIAGNLRTDHIANAQTSRGNMKRLLVAVVCGSITLVIFVAASNPNPASCRDALDQYRSANSDLTDALRTYASCIADSEGHERCAREFLILKTKQEDFESAVNVISAKRALVYQLDGFFSGHYQSECP